MTRIRGIYGIMNSYTCRAYVGSSCCIAKRWREHRGKYVSQLTRDKQRAAALARHARERGT